MIKSVIVTVKIPDKKFQKDIECSTTVPFGEIINVLLMECSNATEEKGNGYKSFADPPGVYISLTETFEEIGVWDGTIITIKK